MRFSRRGLIPSTGEPLVKAQRNQARDHLNPTVDGLFYINMGPPMPLATPLRSVPAARQAEADRAHLGLQGTLGADTFVRITLKAKGGGTMLSLRHTGLKDVKNARAHEEGWGWIVGWLANGFASERR